MRTILFASLVLVTACKKKVPEPPAEVLEKAAVVDEHSPEAHDKAVAEMVANFQRVSFALDSSDLSATSKQALNHNAEIMVKHPRIQVEVQGHADERGTTDYNLALGDRRAASVREYLALMGVPPSRLSTRSFGEEVPLASGHDERAWSENRRCEFRITVPEAGVGGTTTR